MRKEARNRQTAATKMVALLRFIGAGGAALSVEADIARLVSADGRGLRVAAAFVEAALSAGLVTASPTTAAANHEDRLAGSAGDAGAATAAGPDAGGRRLQLLPAARSFMRRVAAETEERFLAQHADVAPAIAEIDGVRQAVRLDRSESPLSTLARLKDRDGAPFLPAEALAAGEKLAADFNRGQLQPRVTASWEPRLSDKGSGRRGGMAELADSAIAARLAVNRAVAAMGPELSGVALDICCFTKGLATVERERQWPARSAKLMLRTALLSLARHYCPARPDRPAATRHWGDGDYRPKLF